MKRDDFKRLINAIAQRDTILNGAEFTDAQKANPRIVEAVALAKWKLAQMKK